MTTPATKASPRSPRRGSRSHRTVTDETLKAQGRLGMLLAAPALILMSVFFFFPLMSAAYFSLTDWDGSTVRVPFIGLGNFAEALTDDRVWQALSHNLIWVVVGTISPLVLGLLLAVLMWSGVRGVIFYRLVFFLPYLMPPIAIGIVWRWIYDPTNGWINKVLEAVGLDGLGRGWLGEPSTALGAVLVTAVWSYTGFVVVIFLAALQNIDEDQVDAGRVDGANALQRLWHIILPQITPIIITVTTVTLVGGFSVFDIVWIMTRGGPSEATEVLGVYAYTRAFENNQVGYGSALALLITAVSAPFVILLNNVQRRMALRGLGGVAP